jgi:cytochrome b subunit of formate dehydrogenase
MPIIGLGRDDDSSDNDSSYDDITSDDEGHVELDTFALYYDNEPIVNQTKEKQEHKMVKEKEESHRTWTAVTYLFTLMLAGVACTTAGIQWGLGTMKNALVRVLFEPIWSIIVLPLFFMSTVVWYFARFLVESPDLQESVKRRKTISKRLRRKQTRAGQRRSTWLPVLFFFISTWGIMTGSVMVSKEFYQGYTPEHPFSLVK